MNFHKWFYNINNKIQFAVLNLYTKFQKKNISKILKNKPQRF